MIELKNVSFSYQNTESPSLQDVSLSIRGGECIVLCGKSGCGKTTLLRLLNGMIPDFYDGQLSGSVRVDGTDPLSCPMHELSKKVGTLFQNPRTQFYTVNTTSEIVFGCENLGFPPETIRKRITQVAEDLHIEALLDRNIFQLSGGEKQKIAFASIYAVDPGIYLLDEPSANLDHHAIRELRSILELLKKQGKTILLAEHRLWYLEGIADRAVYMEKGQLVREYSMEELRDLPLETRIITGLRPVCLNSFEPFEKKVMLPGQKMQVSGLRVSYRKQPVLHIGQAEFPAGCVFAVIGENGAGKSTFVTSLCGLLKKQKGTVLLNGNSYRAKERIPISYMVMQEVNHQLFTDSVEEEVTLGVKSPSPEKLNQVLDDLDISDLRKRHPMTLSGGQKQRVAVAAAVFCEKNILVFDEPTSGLDFSHMMETARIIQQLKGDNIWLFVITHDYEFILAACEAVVEIKNGAIQNQYVLTEQDGQKQLDCFFGVKREKNHE